MTTDLTRQGAQPRGRLLTVAGSDSGGGAGLQADIKTAASMGVYAMTAVTAVTAQDTHRIHQVLRVPASLVSLQMQTALQDIGADAIKTGMLCSKPTVDAVIEAIHRWGAGIPLIVDPVLAASSGEPLLDPEAETALREGLLRRADLVTPNAPEAARLTGLPVTSLDEMRAAGQHMLALGTRAVLVTGGHIAGATVTDLLVTRTEVHEWTAHRIDTSHTHGTGCTLASAVAAELAQGRTLLEATAAAHAYVQQAIRTAPGIGRGQGPLNHLVGHPGQNQAERLGCRPSRSST